MYNEQPSTSTARKPLHEQGQEQLWKSVKPHSYIIYYDVDDSKGELSLGEVLDFEYKGSDDETLIVWASIVDGATTKYRGDRPFHGQRYAPEYIDKRGKSWVRPNAKQKENLDMSRFRYGHDDILIVIPSFTMETGGKVPKRIAEQVDNWLRKRIKEGEKAWIGALNFPRPQDTVTRSTTTGDAIATRTRSQGVASS